MRTGLRWTGFVPHFVLWVGILMTLFPIWVAFVASTHVEADLAQAPLPLLPAGEGWANYRQVLFGDAARLTVRPPVWRMLINSFLMATSIAVGKVAISILSAYAIVFFRFPGRAVAFWAIFITLMLPVEVRIVPTYEVVARLDLLDTYVGLTLPLWASATATLLFRQVFMTIPDELVEAAKLDGAGPLRFFRDIVLPLSRTNIAALFVILFLYGWNQYLWPLLITNDMRLDTIAIGIKKTISGGAEATEWRLVMATTVLALLPPAAVVLILRRQFVKGLVEQEK